MSHFNKFLFVFLVISASVFARGGGGGHGGGGHGGGHAGYGGGHGARGAEAYHGEEGRGYANHPNYNRAAVEQNTLNSYRVAPNENYQVRPNANYEVNPARRAAINRAAVNRAIDRNAGYWGADGYIEGDAPVVVDPDNTNNPQFELETDEEDADDTNQSGNGPSNNPQFSLEYDEEDADDTNQGN